MDVTEIVILCVVGWIVLQVVLGILDGLNRINQKNREELIEEISNRIHQVKIEKHQDINYWYDADSDQFLGQGKTLDEIIDHIKSRFPEHIFLVNKGGIAAETNWKWIAQDDFKKVVITKV